MRDGPLICSSTLELRRSFKTVNGMKACATVALAEGFATPRISGFWKVFWKSPLFDCILRKNWQFIFGKSSVFVELARSFRFGKCLAQTASLRKPETLSILQLEIVGIITCFAAKRKIEKIFSCRRNFSVKQKRAERQCPTRSFACV